MSAEANRSRVSDRALELKKIHFLRRQLGFDERLYREIARRVSARFRAEPVDSSGDMNAAERHALIDELVRLGGRLGPPPEREQDWKATKQPGHRLAEAIWSDLMRLGVVEPGSHKTGLRAFVKKMTGRDHLIFTNAVECSKIVEALKAWRAREHAKRQGAIQ